MDNKQKLMSMKHLVNVSLMLLIFATNLLSQEASVNPLEKGVTQNLTDDGKYFVKFGASMEFWARYAQLNPGSVDFTGKEIKNDFAFDNSLSHSVIY